ncbi:MAG: hypothetical protein VW270_12035 [Candidatus Poseidoniales archaeon]
MLNIINLTPKTRINDHWVTDDSINATPPACKNFKHPMITGEPNDFDTRYQADFYKYIAVDIVVETVINYPYAYVSEKTLRSFACKRMFIVLGAAGTLELLHSKGFYTFNDFIDESYDQIKDPMQRFKAVEKEIKRLCDLPLEDIKSYMEKNYEKFDHNFKTLCNLQQVELQQIARDHNITL